jgi:prepilin-type N-terminal cleavage/methylation domain-containing protein/prepilin-type processing-associated H-X9-DG protein
MNLPRSRHGFTLVELLVVVAIIALLLGILLPSLSRARKIAETTACMAHLRGAGQGMNTYATEYRGFIPGPLTSGRQQTRQDSSYVWDEDPTEPVQNTDWISPALGASLSLPGDRDERIAAMFNLKFKCPTNKQKYTGQYGSGGPSVDPKTLTVSSYSASLGFHFYESNPGTGDLYAPSWLAVTLPSSPRIKLSDLGPSSQKVFAYDGARYLDNSNGEMTFNAFTKQVSGGNYMNFSPALADNVNNGDPYEVDSSGELTDLTKTYGYRHMGKINLVFFDGHCETADNDESRNVRWYFPSGSVVADASKTNDPGDSNGDRID